MRICSFLVLLVCFGFTSRGSSHATHPLLAKGTRVSGQVLDAVSKAPVPNVLVQIDGRGAKTDDKGRFVISRLPNYLFHNGTAATVHTVYYDGETKIKSRKSVGNLTILLHRNRYRFRADKCMMKADSNNVRPYASPVLFDFRPGRIVGMLIKNTSVHAYDTLKTISINGGSAAVNHDFWSGPSGWVPFRLRVYQLNSIRALPGRDLLKENLILCCPKPDSTYTVDLNEYKIVVPNKDFVIAFEPVVQGDCFYTCPEKLVNYKPTRLVLRAPCVFADSRTWSYDVKQAGEDLIGSWRRLTEAENCWPLYENIFSVELSGRK